MFQRKSKPEQVRDKANEAKDQAASGVGSVATAVKDAFEEKVAPKAEAAAGAARDRGSDFAHTAKGHATQVRDRAVSGLDHGIDSAVPKGQEAVASMGPKVDHARDVIVDDILPKISELLGQVQTSKDDVLSRQEAPIAAVTGAPKKKKRKGGALLVFAIAAAGGAAVAYYLNSQKKPASDPWATEHHVGGAPGVDSQVRASMAAKEPSADRATATHSSGTTAGGTTAGAVAAGGTTAGGAATTSSTSSSAGKSDTPIGDSLSGASPSSGAAVPADDADIPGTKAAGSSGFGTDFSDVDTDPAKSPEKADEASDDTKRETDLP